MFNNKYKQRIAELEIANQQLQANCDLLFVTLQARQDDCVSLQAQVAVLRTNQKDNNGNSFIDSVEELQGRLSNQVANLKDLVDELENLYSDSDSDSDSDEDEDEDEDEDDSWDD